MATSLNPTISKFDTGFDAEKTTQYRLTIQFQLGGLSFALFDATDNRLVGFECLQSDLLADSNDLFRALERALELKGLNHKAFQSVTCIVDGRTATLVPEALYSPDNSEQLLGFHFNLPPDCVILSEQLPTHRAVLLYGLPSALQSKMKAKWPDARITHSSAVLLNHLPTSDNATVYVNVRNRDFDMAVMKDKLLFFNNFKFNTADDFAYFLLFAMEQHGLSGQDTPVLFSGFILPSSDIISLCGRYVCDIHFVDKPNELLVSENMAEVPYQYYHNFYQATK